MYKYIKKLLCIMITLVLCISGISISYAENNSRSLTKGQYLIINSNINKMGYFKDGKLIKEFDVATGKSSTPTPQGKFKVVNKIKNRPYYSGGIAGGDPKNPLGDRWIGLHVGLTYGTTYAIHGNNDESSIGKHVSGGCIRMHNSEVRWLFEEIQVGSYAIISNSDNTYSQIASKYGVVLEETITKNQEDVKQKFKEFYIYGDLNNPILNLKDKNQPITKLEYANNILTFGDSTNKSDRQKYVDAWNKLSNVEKSNKEMQDINNEYNKIVSIVQAAQSTLKFYDYTLNNAEKLLGDYNLAKSINSTANTNLGARGKALNDYNNATKTGENSSNSARMKYINTLYNDTVRFLNISQKLNAYDVVGAKNELQQIKDTNLKTKASNYINKFDDIKGHWAEQDIREFLSKGYINGYTDGTIRPNAQITRAEFVKIVNKTFGFTQKGVETFSDVNPGTWYYEEVCIAVNAGYIDKNQPKFRPNDPITRQEAAAIITSIKNCKDNNLNKIKTYKDYNQVSSWALSSVEGAIEKGYMGVGINEFRPKANITRAEAVVTLSRVK